MFLDEVLISLSPNLSSTLRAMQHAHLGIFFVWGIYYEVSKRFSRIGYTSLDTGNAGQHGISYTGAGRLIMLQVVISSLIIAYKVYKSYCRALEFYN